MKYIFLIIGLMGILAFPRENKKDIDEIKKEYVKGIKFHFVDHIREVLDIALI